MPRKLVNLTSMTLKIRLKSADPQQEEFVITLRPSGNVATVTADKAVPWSEDFMVNGLPFDIPVRDRMVFGPIIGLPERDIFNTYVVSSNVAEAVRLSGQDRPDVLTHDKIVRVVDPENDVMEIHGLVQIL